MPANIPTPTDATKDITSPVGEIVKGSPESKKMIVAAIKLITAPIAPPLKDIKADSIRNWRVMSLCLDPTALLIPISTLLALTIRTFYIENYSKREGL